MFKFLRQYNKWILVVFGGLLMLVFLVPTTIQEFSRQSASLGSTWASVGTTKITDGDRLHTAGQLLTLEALEQVLGYPVRMQLAASTGLDSRNPAHWYLLVREAENGGYIGGADEGRSWLQDQLAMSALELSEGEVLGRLAGSSRQTPSQVLEALGNIRGVLRMLEVAAMLPVSDSRAKIAANEAQTSASADVVVINATNALSENEPTAPTPEAMQAHFEKYREVAAGTGDLGFGYLVPNRVKLEWFRVPVESVRASLATDPRLSDLEVRKAYLKDPGSFFPPGVAGQFAAFDDVAVEVRTKVTDKLVRERMSEIERFVEDQVALALRGVQRQGGYLELSEEQRTKQPKYADLIVTVSDQFKIPVPEYHGAGDQWVLPADANTIDPLGRAATMRFGPRSRRLAELLASLREFGGSSTLIVQEGVTGPPLTAMSPTGAPGDVFFFRVVATEAAHAPKSLGEVADAVRNDILRIARFEQLVAQAPEIEKKAIADGLADVAKSFGTTVQFMPRITEAVPTIIPGLGTSPDAVKVILARAMKLPKTTPVADVPDAERTFTVEAPLQLALLVVRITSLKPLAAEDYDRLASTGSLRRTIGARIPGVPLPDLYGYEPLSTRHQFKLARVDEESDAETASE